MNQLRLLIGNILIVAIERRQIQAYWRKMVMRAPIHYNAPDYVSLER